MAKVAEGLSIVFKGTQWVARYKALDSTWSTKRLPPNIAKTRRGEAEAWIRDWYAKYLAQGGVTPDNLLVVASTKVTLSDIYDRWVAYREADPGTDPSYARALKSQSKLWIKGKPIAGLDIKTELGPLAIVSWIRSMTGAASTKLSIASTLSVFITDAILHGHEWGVDPQMPHPMIASPHVVRALDELRKTKDAEHVAPIFTDEEIETMLTTRTSKVWDVRKVKYTLALGTGMRERELQGLTWEDVLDLPRPHVWVRRQLVKAGSAPFVELGDVRKKLGPKADLTKVESAIVKPPKRNSRRTIPLLPLVVEVLKWWRAVGWQQFAGREPTIQDPIFPSGYRNRHQAHGQFCTPDPGRLVIDDLDRLGISRTFTSPENGLSAEHNSRSFRHTFASMLSEVGVDDARIGDLLGHAKKSVTRKNYIVALLNARAEVVSKLRLPDRVVMRATEIKDPSSPKGEKTGRVVEMRR